MGSACGVSFKGRLAEDDMDSEKRRHPRLPIEVEVELFSPGQPVQMAQTLDLSDGGLLLLMDEAKRPPLGTWLQVRFLGTLGEGELPPLVDAMVIRHVTGGVAVQFRED